MFGLQQNQEATMNLSFLEVLREEAGDCFTDVVQIEGGSDRLPSAFVPSLQNHIRFGAKMIAIDQSSTDVTIHYQTTGGRFEATGDYAILTVPFPVLRHVEVLKSFSHTKQRAIRQLQKTRNDGVPSPLWIAFHKRWKMLPASIHKQPPSSKSARPKCGTMMNSPAELLLCLIRDNRLSFMSTSSDRKVASTSQENTRRLHMHGSRERSNPASAPRLKLTQ